MYDSINSMNDSFRDRYLYGAELVGKYDFPQLPVTPINPIGCKPVDFSHANTEKDPKHSMCHFFQDDYRIDRIWDNCERYIPILQNFKYVISPDFSVWDDMTRATQIYNTYRNRVLAWYLMIHGVNVIPCVEMGGKETWDFVFDGLPKHGTVALTTNGGKANEIATKESIKSMTKMVEVLEPNRIIIVGRDIGFTAPDVDIMYFDSCSMQTKKMRGK